MTELHFSLLTTIVVNEVLSIVLTEKKMPVLQKLNFYRRILIGVLFMAAFFALLSFNLFAGAVPDLQPGEFEDFELEDYLAIVAAIGEVEEYPHFLEENAERYKEYQASNPNMPFGTVIAHVNVNIDKGAYNDVEIVPDPDKITVLLNKHFALPEDWSPGDLVDIGNGHMMREEAAAHFAEMREAMREDNLSLVMIVTYRSYSTQRNHFNNAVSRFGRAAAEGGNARPGHSEHQTGLAMDVLHKAHDGGLMMNMGFDRSRQFSWLHDNAHNYGFILRYPQGYRAPSGFTFEPWHWRYAGTKAAKKMKKKGIATFEEYWGRYCV